MYGAGVSPTLGFKLCRIIGKLLLPSIYTVRPVYKCHSREPDNVAFMNNFSLYTG
jgi:hypothetical protein